MSLRDMFSAEEWARIDQAVTEHFGKQLAELSGHPWRVDNTGRTIIEGTHPAPPLTCGNGEHHRSTSDTPSDLRFFPQVDRPDIRALMSSLSPEVSR